MRIAEVSSLRWPTWVAIVLSICVVVCAGAARVEALPTAFTHVDDIGVASTIFEARREFRSAEDLRRAINNTRLRQYGSPKFRLLRKADAAGLLAPAYGVLAIARDVLAVPARWTYAPLQYVITAPLISQDDSYRRVLAMGRAPSAMFSMMAVGLVGFLAWRLRSAGDAAAPVMALTVMALSLELFVYSAHMSNYALGVLAAAALVAVAGIDPSRWRSALPSLGLGVAAWGLSLSSYQVMPLVAAAFATIGLTRVVTELQGAPSVARGLAAALKSPWLRRLALGAAAFVLLTAPTYLVLISSVRPITWNGGPHGEFIFPGGAAAAGFVFRNAWLIFSSVTTPVAWEHPLRAPLTAVFAGLFVVGLGRLLSDVAQPRRFAAGLFIAISLIVTLAMAVARLTALSPTRHALILLPLFSIAIGEGVALILRRATRSEAPRSLAVAGVAAGLLAVWGLAMPAELKRRQDPFDEPRLAAEIAANRPSAVLTYDYTYAPELMPAVRGQIALFNTQNLNFPWFAGRLPTANGPTMVLSSGGPLGAAQRDQILQAVTQGTPPTVAWRWCGDAQVLHAEEMAARSNVEVYPIPDGGVNGYFAYLLAPCTAGGGRP